jgi:hypothetical protein
MTRAGRCGAFIWSVYLFANGVQYLRHTISIQLFDLTISWF